MDSSRILLITGGGRGIGAATAQMAAKRGYFVCINYRRNADAAAGLLDQIRDRGGNGHAIQADVGDQPAVTRMFEAIDALPGALVGLVNSAGIVAPAARFEETAAARWRAVFNTNVLGTMHCSRDSLRFVKSNFEGVGAGSLREEEGGTSTSSSGSHMS